MDYRNVRVVAIGGGTGLSTMLRGLKRLTQNLTAIITVADDGGSSGMLRDNLGMLPPGDIRNCILALAETEPVMERLLRYRFSDGNLAGQSFGNLFLAAMDGISENFAAAVKSVSAILNVTGDVLPVTLTDIHINAILKDGTVIKGECNISHGLKTGDKRIESIELVPKHAPVLPEALEAIAAADLIVLGPGSIYTSIIPNLLIDGMANAIAASKAKVVYVCNIMTQPGESDEMTAFDHVAAIYRHVPHERFIDYCIANSTPIPQALAEKYTAENAAAVQIDAARFAQRGIRLIEGDFLSVNGALVRHNYDLLAQQILNLYN